MTEQPRRIAILDDDPDQLLALGKWLGDAGFATLPFWKGRDLLEHLAKNTVDVAFIDWGLPDIQGIDVIKDIRERLKLDVPIVMLTSRNSEEDIVEGLSAGADDYLIKPARRLECLARAEAALRRARSVRAERAMRDEPVHHGAYRFDIALREVSFASKKITLTEKELQLILLLFAEIGKEVSRKNIWSSVWGIISAEMSSRTVDTHIYRLRTKLELDGQHGYSLKTLHGKGYRLTNDETTGDASDTPSA
jgi:two-component system, OmpR family, response regulator RegX3